MKMPKKRIIALVLAATCLAVAPALAGDESILKIGGTTYTHPDYNPNVFYIRDLGVVVLDGKGMAMSQYGKLPGLNSLDALKPRVAAAS